MCTARVTPGGERLDARSESVWRANFPGKLRNFRPPLLPGFMPRPEGPRQSWRSGSRSDSFRGPGRAGCTEMHYSPQELAENKGPSWLLFSSLSPLPFLPSPPLRS